MYTFLFFLFSIYCSAGYQYIFPIFYFIFTYTYQHFPLLTNFSDIQKTHYQIAILSIFYLIYVIGFSLAVWGYGSASISVISVLGLLAVSAIPCLQKVFLNTVLQFLVALAVGALTGDAMLHLLPHVSLQLLLEISHYHPISIL